MSPLLVSLETTDGDRLVVNVAQIAAYREERDYPMTEIILTGGRSFFVKKTLAELAEVISAQESARKGNPYPAGY